MPIVVMPDGTHVQMPDAPPADLSPPTAWDSVKPYAVAAARGIPMSVGGTLSLVKDPSGGPTALSTLGDFITSKTNELLPASKEGNAYGKAALEGATGAVAFPGGIVKNAITGAVSGIGGEGGQQVGGTAGRVIGTLAGGVAAGGGLSLLRSGSAQTQALARASLEDLPPGALEKAQAFQAEAATRGVTLDLVQSLQGIGVPAPVLQKVRDVLSGSMDGKRVQKTLGNQAPQLDVAGDVAIGSMPGSVREEGVAANNLAQAATARIQLEKAKRTELWGNTLADGVQTLKDSANAAIGTQAPVVNGLRQQLQTAQGILQKAMSGDAAAIAQANTAAQQAKDLVAKLQTFSLPRGTGTTPRGTLLDASGRGEAVDFDQIARQTAAERAAAALLPPVAPGKSTATLAAENNVAGIQGNLTKETATLEDLRAQRNAITSVPPEAVQGVAQKLDAMIAQYPNTGQGTALQRLRDNLFRADGSAITDPTQLNNVLKTEAARLKSVDLATSGLDAGTAKWVGAQIDNVRGQLGDAFTPVKAANAAYSGFTTDFVDPLKQGPVGTLATKRGYQADTQASVAKMNSLFAKGTDPQASTSAIRTAGGELNKVDPGAFADAAKTYISGNKEKIFASIAGEGPEARKQWQGLKDMATISAQGAGVPPADVVRGLEAFAQMTKAALNRPASIGGATASEIASMGGNTLAGSAMRMVGVAPLKPLAERLEHSVLGGTYARFDELLTTPEGAQLLAKLGKTPIMSPAAQTLLATFGAGQATQPQPTR